MIGDVYWTMLTCFVVPHKNELRLIFFIGVGQSKFSLQLKHHLLLNWTWTLFKGLDLIQLTNFIKSLSLAHLWTLVPPPNTHTHLNHPYGRSIQSLFVTYKEEEEEQRTYIHSHSLIIGVPRWSLFIAQIP